MQIISKAELSSLKTQLESLLNALIEINDKSSIENEIDASNRNLLETERHLRGALRELEHLFIEIRRKEECDLLSLMFSSTMQSQIQIMS